MEDAEKSAPNFFILGAAKSGTTSLYKLLMQHPDIYLPADKEPRFFDSDRYFNQGADVYLRNHFTGSENFAVRGEASPHYLSHYDRAAPRIKQAFGVTPRFIIIMRDPVRRAWSHYLHQVHLGIEKKSFPDALKAEETEPEERRAAWTNYFGDGLYARQIKGWLKYFPESNFLFLFTEDLRRDYHEVVRTAFAFLEVDSGFSVTQQHVNISSRSKSLLLGSLLNRPNLLNQTFKYLFPYIVRQRIRDAINRWNRAPFIKTPILDSSIERELRQKYLPDIMETEILTGKNLSQWKRAKRSSTCPAPSQRGRQTGGNRTPAE